MSDEPADTSVNVELGCTPIVGAVIVAIAVGHIYTEAHGWLAFGAALIFFGSLRFIRRGARP